MLGIRNNIDEIGVSDYRGWGLLVSKFESMRLGVKGLDLSDYGYKS